jgi:hypothetical protein
MAVAFYQTVHCPQLVDTLVHALAQKSRIVGQCKIWSSQTDRDGYGILRISHQSKRLQLYVHRLAHFRLDPSQKLIPKYHVSNSCHNKLCVNGVHLSYEPAMINNARKVCRGRGECIGHRGYKRCAVDLVYFCVKSAFLFLLLFFLFG